MGLKRTLSGVVAAAMLTGGLAACGASSSDEDVIKVGLVFPQSGELAYTGQRAMQGAEIAAQLVNDAGGVDGKKIEIVSVDANSPAAAKTGVKQLATRDDVQIFVGSASSSIGTVGAQTAEQFGALYWETGATAESMTTSGYEHVFRTITSGGLLGEYAANYVVDNVAPALGIAPADLKVALVYTDDAYGASIAPAEKEAFEAAGVEVYDYSYTAASMKDFSPIILKLKDNQVDVTLAAAQLADSVLFWNQAQQLGYTPKAGIGTGAGYAEAGFAEGLGPIAEGVFNAVPPTPGAIDTSALSEEALSLLEEYGKVIEDKGYTQTPNMDWAFMGAYALFNDVLPEAKSMSVDDLAKAAHSIDIPASDTVTGMGIKFDESGQNTEADPIVMQWQGGAQKAVFPPEVATSEVQSLPLPPLGG